ncbi:MAG TPA: Hpt domain-containing protein [Nitrospiraceae bacterium]|nr:Hpt domain-containing protein [Nitrospiraceae bacterium]
MINEYGTDAQAKVTVYVDPALAEIVPGFLENRRRDVQSLQIALQQNDLKTICVLGHRMKGDGGGYGFDTISAIGEALELAAAQQDRPTIERQTLELNDFLTRLDVVYRK